MPQSKTLTPHETLELLKEGNRRFVAGEPVHPNADDARRNEVTKGQSPFAAILTCSDSRVPPEILFDSGIGDIFVIRVAGNVLDDTVTASILYAAMHLECPLIVVLGHGSCGAITTSLASDKALADEPETIKNLVGRIRNNIPNSYTATGGNDKKLTSAITENTMAVTKQIAALAPVGERIAEGKTDVRAAHYSLETGEVSWL